MTETPLTVQTSGPTHAPYPDWPACRRGTNAALTVADVLDKDPLKYVLLCDAQHGGWVVALLTIPGIRRMIAQHSIDPRDVKLKFWNLVTWENAHKRLTSDREYAQQVNHINPYTGRGTL